MRGFAQERGLAPPLQGAEGAVGSGGRSSASGATALVLGSTGFAGRYLVNALGRSGTRMVLPVRHNENHSQHLRVMGDLGQISIRNYDCGGEYLRDPEELRRLARGCNIVVNAVGRDYDTHHFRMKEVHVDFARNVAEAAAAEGAERLVHLSALGAGPESSSERLRTKWEGEEAVRAAFPDATVLRPAPMTGVEDRLLNNLAVQTLLYPFMPIVEGGEARLQPVYVADVAQALMAVLGDCGTRGGSYDLAGPDVFTLREITDWVQDTIREPRRGVPVPAAALRAFDAPRQWLLRRAPMLLGTTNLMLTADWADTLEQDLVVGPGQDGLDTLGVAKTAVNQGLAAEFVRFWRQGGYDVGTEGT